MKWLRLYSDVVSDPKVQRLPADKFKAWINLLCVACQHDGILPPLADLAFTLRIAEDKITTLLDDLVDKRLLDVTSDDRYTPHNWASRQYKSDVSNDRVQRHRQRKRSVTVTPPDSEQNRSDPEAVTALIEVSDEAALAAWDDYGRQTTGKAYPRNRRGGWHFPSKWPPGHEAEIVQVATGRRS
jgi:hypothetical protein